MMWQLCVDTGGTFTDCVGVDPSGRIHRAKVLSSSALRARVAGSPSPRRLRIDATWSGCDDLVRGFALARPGDDGTLGCVRAYDATRGVLELDAALATPLPPGSTCELRCPAPAPILAARVVTSTPATEPLPAMELRLGTTRGTNALLERAGRPTALFMTAGLGDVLEIGDQQRPDLFALQIAKRPCWHERTIEVEERLAADGSVIRALSAAHLDELADRARDLLRDGVRCAAVALLHSYRNPAHEQQVAARLRDAGCEHVSTSAELAPLIKLLPRAETAVVDAYLGPIVRGYLDEVRAHLGDGRLLVMTSAGGLEPADAFRAVDSLLSGPAGGVIGAHASGRAAGRARIIGFDMGGTSTDVSRCDGRHEYAFDVEIAGARVLRPAMAIETVASGGGSICELRHERLCVGPRSAGAAPGPACYGGGGPLTVTDVNLLAGRLDASCFEIPLEVAAAGAALRRVRDAIDAVHGSPPSEDELLDGFLQIANERMAAAIARVSTARGYDPSRYALVGFGGAGGQHACAVADLLGIRDVVLPADASLLSAVGLRAAVLERIAERQILERYDDLGPRAIAGWLDDLGAVARRAVVEAGADPARVAVRRRIVFARLLGQETSLELEHDEGEPLPRAFARRYRALYRHEPPEKPIEIESIRVVAADDREGFTEAPAPDERRRPRAERRIDARFAGRRLAVDAYDRTSLRAGDALCGPALVLDRRTTVVLDPGWSAIVDDAGAIRCRRETVAHDAGGSSAEIVRQELFTNRLQDIVEDAGRLLQRTAVSTNVKERLDFSCALLDAEGRLVVNAPHIPVHLGAMGSCVRAVRASMRLQDGDVVVTNHPAFGGTHLPDVTVVTPVFADGRLLGYVASRAHHAEIGGMRPGSMPPASTRLEEEGVIIAPRLVVRGGRSLLAEVAAVLSAPPFATRALDDNLADLQAAIAANEQGAERLRELAGRDGVDATLDRMDRIRERAARLLAAAFRELPAGRRHAREELDDGAPIEVAIDIAGDRAVIDFAGSAARHPGNLNATAAIVQSAVMYVLRLLIGERLPLNEGLLDAIELRVPPGMLDPGPGIDDAGWPAVAGGNVETSQRIVDTLLRAMRLCACSQGTMNNVLFGDARFGYYETVCGGAGAGPGYDGADAVHTHMTNTRLTDPEVLEHRYPVRVRRFAIRRGSGGAGRYRGGDGVVRELEFLRPVSVSILSQHRREGPYGMEGGAAGATGAQRLVRRDGSVLELRAVDGCEAALGDRLVLETPGGGGWGAG